MDSPFGYHINPAFLDRIETRHGGDVKVLVQSVNGRPVVTSVVHVGPDLHFLVPPGALCWCGWRAPAQ